MIRLHDDEPRGHAVRPLRRTARRHLLDLREAIKAIREGWSYPRWESRAWPAGLDRSLFLTLPLQSRTRNCLRSANIMQGDDPITAGSLLKIPHFGQRELQDLLFTLENFLNQSVSAGSATPNQESAANKRLQTPSEGSIVSPAKIGAPRTSWKRAERILNPPLAVAAELFGAKTLADVLSPKFMRLTSRMGIDDAIGMIGIGDLTRGTPGFVSATLSRLSLTLDTATATERIIIEQRLLRTPRATLEEIGSRVGVTRERIRQLQTRIERNVRNALGKEGRTIAAALKEQFDFVVPRDEVDRRIEEILPADQSLATRLLSQRLIDEMGFTLNDGMYLDESATQQFKDIRALTRKFSDDVGLLDKQQLIASLPDERWQPFWPWVRERCGLHELFGTLAIRDSGKARTKAALVSIGRPATREEIARICGFGERKTASHLSVIPSVVKADKKRWGLKDWVDGEYKGIAAEIIQRIEENGGATTTEKLLAELPGKFGVNLVSVRAYMQTPKFEIRDGWISLANPSSIQFGDLDDIIDGRDRDGDPYWTFAVESRFFEGYSVTGVPPEFAKALGCTPDAGERVRIDNLPNCPDLSIRWPLTSTTGASLGYLAKPLGHLGLEVGQRARVTIKGALRVELSADDGNAGKPRISGADAILKRMMQRRKVL